MKLADLLSDMIANGATVEEVRVVVEAARRQDDAREVKRREQTAARVRKHRETKRTNVTPVTQETRETRYTKECPQTPKENYIPPSPPSGAQTPKGVQPARGTRIASDWKLDEVGRAYGLSIGLTPADLDREAEKFRDWWLGKAGADGRKADWAATWRTWARGAVERRGRANGARAGPRHAEVRNSHAAALDLFVEREFS